MNEPIGLRNAMIIGLTCRVSWLGFKSRAVEEKYIFEPEAILAWKEYYRLLTSGFLHAGWWHLLVNMLSLYLLGRYVEISFGAGHFLMIYFGAIVGGNVLSLYVHRHHEYRAYGASGGVCGIIFAYILLFPGAGIYPFMLPFAIPAWLYAIGYIAFSFYGMKEHNRGNIGHDAHLGGAILGLLIAAALYPESVRYNALVFLIVLVSALALLVYLWLNPLFLPAASFAGQGSYFRRLRFTPRKGREPDFDIDTILDKIATGGLESLPPHERTFLESTSQKYRRRANSQKPESG